MILQGNPRRKYSIYFLPTSTNDYFPENHNLKLLQTIDEKVESLASFGLDNLIIYPFTKGVFAFDSI